MSKGWITIDRDMQDHWIFSDAEKLRAWLIMLITVNHKPNKVQIKGKIMTCGRGQSLMSHNSWAVKFGKKWNRAKVIRFFKVMESEHMIVQQNEQVTTRLTICNYSQYQDKSKKNEQASEHQPEQVTVQQADTKRTGDSTQLNNDNNKKRKPSVAVSDEEFHSVPNLNIAAWGKWMDFRKVAKLGRYKTLNQARKLASFSPQAQMDAVINSISQEYSGLFPKETKPTKNQSVVQLAMQKHRGEL